MIGETAYIEAALHIFDQLPEEAKKVRENKARTWIPSKEAIKNTMLEYMERGVSLPRATKRVSHAVKIELLEYEILGLLHGGRGAEKETYSKMEEISAMHIEYRDMFR